MYKSVFSKNEGIRKVQLRSHQYLKFRDCSWIYQINILNIIKIINVIITKDQYINKKKASTKNPTSPPVGFMLNRL